MPPLEPPLPGRLVLPLVNPLVFEAPLAPPLATLKSIPERPSSGARIDAVDPDCANRALRISANSTALACLSGMFFGMPA